jgi:hypothetical protein
MNEEHSSWKIEGERLEKMKSRIELQLVAFAMLGTKDYVKVSHGGLHL